MSHFKADLHCHSTSSDGTVDPEGLVKLALQIGLSGLSITDHDTIDAYAKALPMAEAFGLRMISGVEFSTVHRNVSIHLLGYSFDLKNKDIQDFCKKHQKRREKRNLEILNLLEAHRMNITMKDVKEAMGHIPGTIGRPHIALAMMKKGYVKSIEEAFRKYLGDGKCCYTPGTYFGVEETIDIIHKAGGYAVIAHPHLIQNEGILKNLLAMPFDGIECYYARMVTDQNTRWLEIAAKKNWLITGGSDFHGEVKANIPLGSSWIDQEHFKPLEIHYLKHVS